MILIVTTKEHRYTHAELESERELQVRVVSYDELLRRSRPFRATHVFTDLDRLPSWRVGRAAALYRQLAQAGIRALNDPARQPGRFGLLRTLNRHGINAFDAYRADALEQPSRWPVFLRVEGDHRAPVSGLLNGPEELRRAIEDSLDRGHPLSALLIIEYAAEPVREGLFRKLSVFRVGDRVLGYTCTHEDSWLVKYGKPGIAPPELYEEEFGFVTDPPFADVMRRAFDLAGIHYGRIDYGMVNGRPQIYEINSNPSVKLRPKPSAVPRRNDSTDLFRANYLAAMKAIDTPDRRAALAWTVRMAPDRALAAGISLIGKAKAARTRVPAPVH